MKSKEEIPHVKSYVFHFAWDFFGNLPFLYPQIAWNHAELMFGFAQPFPPLLERLFLLPGSSVKYHLMCLVLGGKRCLRFPLFCSAS